MTPDADRRMDETDRAVLASIERAALVHDPVPPGLLDRIMFGVSLELMQAELAVLADHDLATTRAEAVESADTLTFTATSTSLMVVITDHGESVRIDGWVTGGGVEVDLHTDSEVIGRTSDATGRLSWPLVAHGSVRFLIHPHREGARAVVTPVIEV